MIFSPLSAAKSAWASSRSSYLLTSAKASSSDALLRRGVAGASCIIAPRGGALDEVAAAGLYLGDVKAGLKPRKHAAA